MPTQKSFTIHNTADGNHMCLTVMPLSGFENFRELRMTPCTNDGFQLFADIGKCTKEEKRTKSCSLDDVVVVKSPKFRLYEKDRKLHVRQYGDGGGNVLFKNDQICLKSNHNVCMNQDLSFPVAWQKKEALVLSKNVPAVRILKLT